MQWAHPSILEIIWIFYIASCQPFCSKLRIMWQMKEWQWLTIIRLDRFDIVVGLATSHNAKDHGGSLICKQNYSLHIRKIESPANQLWKLTNYPQFQFQAVLDRSRISYRSLIQSRRTFELFHNRFSSGGFSPSIFFVPWSSIFARSFSCMANDHSSSCYLFVHAMFRFAFFRTYFSSSIHFFSPLSFSFKHFSFYYFFVHAFYHSHFAGTLIYAVFTSLLKTLFYSSHLSASHSSCISHFQRVIVITHITYVPGTHILAMPVHTIGSRITNTYLRLQIADSSYKLIDKHHSPSGQNPYSPRWNTNNWAWGRRITGCTVHTVTTRHVWHDPPARHMTSGPALDT